MFNDRLRRFMHRKATDDEKREYLTELLQKGQQAESLNEFLDEFIAQKQQEILQRLNSNEYPEAIQLEYKVVMELLQPLLYRNVMHCRKENNGGIFI